MSYRKRKAVKRRKNIDIWKESCVLITLTRRLEKLNGEKNRGEGDSVKRALRKGEIRWAGLHQTRER